MGFEDGMLLGAIDGITHGIQDGTGASSDNDTTLLGQIDRDDMLELGTIEGTMLCPIVERPDSK